LEQRYDGAREEIQAAVTDLLSELKGEGLIRAGEELGAEAAVSFAADGVPASRSPFKPPRLEKHTDMQDLILIDPVHEVSAAGWPHRAEPTEAST
jgi:hypothetical protein